jgi:NAD(P)H-dependent FMN reductase
MKIALVLGTARKNNNSQKVFDAVSAKLIEIGHEVDPVKVEDYLLSYTTTRAEQDSQNSEKVESWAGVVEKNEAVIFVTPEYNHSYPGELKLLVDSLYGEYKDKKAGIVGVSMGPYGGTRVVELLKLLLLTVNFHVANKTVLYSGVSDIVDSEQIEKQLPGLIEELSK